MFLANILFVSILLLTLCDLDSQTHTHIQRTSLFKHKKQNTKGDF